MGDSGEQPKQRRTEENEANNVKYGFSRILSRSAILSGSVL